MSNVTTLSKETNAAPSGIGVYGGDVGQFGKDVSQDTQDLWAEIKRLDLAEHVGELEVLGLTVIPPSKVASPEFTLRLRDKILEVGERRTGAKYDLKGAADSVYNNDKNKQFGTLLLYTLLEDPIFQEAMLNPAAMAMTTYLLGSNAVANTCSAFIKGPGTGDLALHTDQFIAPPPYPLHPNLCNNTFALTDYNLENGGLCYVPGSHHYHRQPLPGEGMDQRVVVNAKAGSLIIWSGNLWHGAMERTAPGLRVTLSCSMVRPHIRSTEDYSRTVTQEILDRNPARFAKLIGRHIRTGFESPAGPKDMDFGYEMGRHRYE